MPPGPNPAIILISLHGGSQKSGKISAFKLTHNELLIQFAPAKRETMSFRNSWRTWYLEHKIFPPNCSMAIKATAAETHLRLLYSRSLRFLSNSKYPTTRKKHEKFSKHEEDHAENPILTTNSVFRITGQSKSNNISNKPVMDISGETSGVFYLFNLCQRSRNPSASRLYTGLSGSWLSYTVQVYI